MAKRTNNKGFIRGVIVGIALMWGFSHKDVILKDMYLDMKYSYYAEQLCNLEKIGANESNHALHSEWLQLFNTLRYLDAQR